MCVCVRAFCSYVFLLYTNPSRLYALCMLDVFDCFRWNIQHFINRTNFTLEKQKERKKYSQQKQEWKYTDSYSFSTFSFYRLKLWLNVENDASTAQYSIVTGKSLVDFVAWYGLDCCSQSNQRYGLFHGKIESILWSNM